MSHRSVSDVGLSLQCIRFQQHYEYDEDDVEQETCQTDRLR